uniref:Uncharacterized protein n=1 Tax=Strigops habroptila TaxID=2489341 RepID=A0A672TGP3_STRHB
MVLAVWHDPAQLPRDMSTASHHFGLLLTKEAPCDADLASIKDKKHFQACSEDHSTNRIHPIHSEETSGETAEFVTLTFPKKLWKIICVAIDEEASLKEPPA